MDDQRRRLAHADVLILDGVVNAVASTSDRVASADETIDLSGHLLMPGLVNGHHHLFQSLTRAVPQAQTAALPRWLDIHRRLWTHLTPAAVEVAARFTLAELVLSGATTTLDHFAYDVDGSCSRAILRAADAIGVRLILAYGGSAGIAPPDSRALRSSMAVLERLIDQFSEPAGSAMRQLLTGPTNIVTIDPSVATEWIAHARKLGIGGHTHVGETRREIAVSETRYGRRPVEHARRVGWAGPDVSFAHAVHVDSHDAASLAATGTSVIHCPTSNARLGSGIASLRRYARAGVRVGLGVDGSASNDGSNALAETRVALLLQRARWGATAMDPLEALELATRESALALGRPDLGVLAPGHAADAIAFDLRRPEFAGAADPIGALVLCAPTEVDFAIVNGRVLVRDRRLLGFDWGRAAADLRHEAQKLSP